MIDLSILVLTIESRAHYLRRLLDVLEPQLNDRVELKVLCDDGEESIGEKRNRAVAQAAGRWICFIDDDDWIVPDYVASIQRSLTTDPDCVGFNVQVNEDGRYDCMSYISCRNPGYTTERSGGVKRYIRTPNHLCPIRAEFVRATPFAEINFGEDTDYASRIKKLLKSEAYIDRTLYVYDHRSAPQRAGERTNKDRKKQ